jgi:hydrophobic/amphiphilic exporter-1 (mainly G- bacteria), HAE1 family
VTTSYNSLFFITMKNWGDRKGAAESYGAIKAHLQGALSRLPAGVAFIFPPPAIPGVGNSGGFNFVLEDRSGSGSSFLVKNLQTFLEAARKRPELTGLNTTALYGVPQVNVSVDKAKVLTQGVNLADVYQTLQTFMGGSLVNYFNRFGRQWQVYVQADGADRTQAQNVGEFYVKNASAQMVPMSTLTSIEPSAGPEFIFKYNQYEAVQINGSAAPGYSSGQAMAALEAVFHETMPVEMGFDYTGMSYQEQQAALGVSPAAIFAMSFLVVFLIMAAQYESWSLPFSVLLGTPIAVFGAFLALNLRALENNVYAQIGLVMLIGLSAKNAILIVEFAKAEYERSIPIDQAALAGARLRLRPILMTAFAFILGCVPLWTASGAGAVARRVLGTTVIGGMLAASLIAIFFIPMTFDLVERLANRNKAPTPKPLEPEAGAANHD